MDSSVVTRFAPSPSGRLHLGGARTALFNWLFAKKKQGKFLLRIEDTDAKRSSESVVDSIMEDLAWLGIEYDDEVVFQSKRIARYVEVAEKLLSLGHAYNCYCSEEEIEAQRLECKKNGVYYQHICPWRDKNRDTQATTTRVVRFKSPREGETSFTDKVYGKVTVKNSQVDDMVVLRSDDSPTYLLAVVVDDHDMNITHIIRGSDHITNTTKQILLAEALGWTSPQFSHIPLIHDESGLKLSKRRQAPGISMYKESGFLPEALCNYLIRMGWGHGNDDIISLENAIKWFSMEGVGVSPSRLNDKKLQFFNRHYIKTSSDERILSAMLPFLEKEVGTTPAPDKKALLLKGMKHFKERAENLLDLTRNMLFYVQEDMPLNLISTEALDTINEHRELIPTLLQFMSTIEERSWSKDYLSSQIKEVSRTHSITASSIYNLLRATITGALRTPSIVEIMEVLGKEKCTHRLSSFERQSAKKAESR